MRSSIRSAVVGRELLGPGQLLPQLSVPIGELVDGRDHVDLGDAAGGDQVTEVAGDVGAGDLQVVLAEGVGDRGVALAGLRIDQVRHQGAGISPEQDVVERAVAPEEAVEVQTGEQDHAGVHQPRPQVEPVRVAEQVAVREGEVEVAGDEHRSQLAAIGIDPGGDHTDRLDDRQSDLGQFAQQPVLAPSRSLGGGLEGVHTVVVGDEAHHVAGDAVGHAGQAPTGGPDRPFLQGPVPGQVEEVGVPAAGAQFEARPGRGHCPTAPTRRVAATDTSAFQSTSDGSSVRAVRVRKATARSTRR